MRANAHTFPMIGSVSTHTKPQARHSSKDLGRHLARKILLCCFTVVFFLTSAAALAYYDLQSQVNRVDIGELLGTDRPTRPDGEGDSYEGRAVNILILGSDSRTGANNVDGSEGTEDVLVARSDTAMIMHISADRTRIEVVSIPRDTMVDIPSCKTAAGETTEEWEDAQFNYAFQTGAGEGDNKEAVAAGAACTIRTVEKMTGIFIDEFMVVDFNGLSTMIDSLGGVNVYVDEDIDDADYTGLVLPAGCHHMDGTMALQYARVRHGVGDGSDLSRISRQQNLMSAMMRTAKQKNLLTDADELYSFARDALGSLTTSEKIGELTTLAGLAQSIQAIGMDKITFVTMPYTPSDWDPNRVVPSPEADAVWDALIHDKPVPEESVSTTADGPVPGASAESTTSEAESTDDTQTDDPDGSSSQTQPPSGTATATDDPAAQCR